MAECFLCHKIFKTFDKRVDTMSILADGYQPPEGMSKQDRICKDCFNNIKNTQEKIQVKKYVKELDVTLNIIGSYIPIWNLIVAMNLGWRYGTLSVLTHVVVLYGLIIMGSVLVNTDNIGLGLLLIFSSLPMNGIITWFFIKKHNDRVKANKSGISSN